MVRKLPQVKTALNLKIKPDEIIQLVNEIAERHDRSEDIGFEATFLTLFRRYKSRRNGGERAMCVHFRMQCLSKLMKTQDARLRGYTKPTSDPGCNLTSSAMFHATALCPIRNDGNDIWFDPDEFFDLALREADSEGNA